MIATGLDELDDTAAEYRLTPMRLEGKIALVTGGASGIGAATARRLAAEGARVAIGDIAEDGAREVAGELDGLACRLDVADAASVRDAVAEIERSLGPVDVLVNNAGTDRFSFFVNTDEELWDFVLGVNLRGTHRRHPRGARAGCRSGAAARSSTSPARPAASARRARSSTPPRRPA